MFSVDKKIHSNFVVGAKVRIRKDSALYHHYPHGIGQITGIGAKNIYVNFSDKPYGSIEWWPGHLEIVSIFGDDAYEVIG